MQKFLVVAGIPDNPDSRSQGEPTPEMIEAMRDIQRNLEFFLEHYLRPITGYQLDIEALLVGSTQVVAAVGEASAGQLAYRGAVALAERLGREVVVFPGDHGGFTTHPDAFAAALHQVLAAG
jgi:hypothetical protein